MFNFVIKIFNNFQFIQIRNDLLLKKIVTGDGKINWDEI